MSSGGRLDMAPYEMKYKHLQSEETMRLNHEVCGDTKGRLYFTRKDNVVLGFCHNCQQRGARRPKTYYVSVRSPITFNGHGPKGEWVKDLPPKLPLHTVPIYSEDYPNSSHDVWCGAYANVAHVTWDALTSSYVIPVYDSLHSTGPVGYQGYMVRNTIRAPKYIRHVSNEFRGWMIYDAAPRETPIYDACRVVLVEDQLSAAAISLTGNIGVALFGAKQTLEKVFQIVNELGKKCAYTVWYDNDNEYVNQSAHTTFQYLNMLGVKNTCLISNMTDPKHYTVDEISGYLKGCV